jgi:hypothetical protein
VDCAAAAPTASAASAPAAKRGVEAKGVMVGLMDKVSAVFSGLSGAQRHPAARRSVMRVIRIYKGAHGRLSAVSNWGTFDGVN